MKKEFSAQKRTAVQYLGSAYDETQSGQDGLKGKVFEVKEEDIMVIPQNPIFSCDVVSDRKAVSSQFEKQVTLGLKFLDLGVEGSFKKGKTESEDKNFKIIVLNKYQLCDCKLDRITHPEQPFKLVGSGYVDAIALAFGYRIIITIDREDKRTEILKPRYTLKSVFKWINFEYQSGQEDRTFSEPCHFNVEVEGIGGWFPPDFHPTNPVELEDYLKKYTESIDKNMKEEYEKETKWFPIFSRIHVEKYPSSMTDRPQELPVPRLEIEPLQSFRDIKIEEKTIIAFEKDLLSKLPEHLKKKLRDGERPLKFEKMLEILKENLLKFPITRLHQPIFVIGNTGVGKSTLVAYSLGMPMGFNGEEGQINVDKNHEDFKEFKTHPTIRGGQVAVTRSPEVFMRENEIFIDFAGFGDSRGMEADIINAMMMQILTGSAYGIKTVIFVIDQAIFESRNLETKQSLLNSEQILRDLLKDPEKNIFEGSLKFVINKIDPTNIRKFSKSFTVQHYIEKGLRGWEDALNENEKKLNEEGQQSQPRTFFGYSMSWLPLPTWSNQARDSKLTKQQCKEQERVARAKSLVHYMLKYPDAILSPDVLDGKGDEFRKKIKKAYGSPLKADDFIFDQYRDKLKYFIYAIMNHAATQFLEINFTMKAIKSIQANISNLSNPDDNSALLAAVGELTQIKRDISELKYGFSLDIIKSVELPSKILSEYIQWEKQHMMMTSHDRALIIFSEKKELGKAWFLKIKEDGMKKIYESKEIRKGSRIYAELKDYNTDHYDQYDLYITETFDPKECKGLINALILTNDNAIYFVSDSKIEKDRPILSISSPDSLYRYVAVDRGGINKFENTDHIKNKLEKIKNKKLAKSVIIEAFSKKSHTQIKGALFYSEKIFEKSLLEKMLNDVRSKKELDNLQFKVGLMNLIQYDQEIFFCRDDSTRLRRGFFDWGWYKGEVRKLLLLPTQSHIEIKPIRGICTLVCKRILMSSDDTLPNDLGTIYLHQGKNGMLKAYWWSNNGFISSDISTKNRDKIIHAMQGRKEIFLEKGESDFDDIASLCGYTRTLLAEGNAEGPVKSFDMHIEKKRQEDPEFFDINFKPDWWGYSKSDAGIIVSTPANKHPTTIDLIKREQEALTPLINSEISKKNTIEIIKKKQFNKIAMLKQLEEELEKQEEVLKKLKSDIQNYKPIYQMIMKVYELLSLTSDSYDFSKEDSGFASTLSEFKQSFESKEPSRISSSQSSTSSTLSPSSSYSAHFIPPPLPKEITHSNTASLISTSSSSSRNSSSMSSSTTSR